MASLGRGARLGDRVLGGEVIVVRGLLGALGLETLFLETSLGAVADVLGPARAADVRDRGIERIHEVIDPVELMEVTRAGYRAYRAVACDVARAVTRSVFGGTRCWLEEDPNVRFTVPYRHAARHAVLESFEWNGKVTAHGPHHDSWYACPTNAVNVWIAVGRVRVGNGLTIYPHVHGLRLPCDERGRIAPGQYFSGPCNVELEPGDALVFHGEHLHASELNWTDETRHVASLRMTLDRPRFLGPSPYRFDYVPLLAGGGRPQELRARAADHVRRARRAASRRWYGTRLGARRRPGDVLTGDHGSFTDTSVSFPAPLEGVEPGRRGDAPVTAELHRHLRIGEIRTISDSQCAARIDDDKVVVFGRRCPHQGADLAGGYVRGGEIVCPWHNLPFDGVDGRSRCGAVAPLALHRVVVAR